MTLAGLRILSPVCLPVPPRPHPAKARQGTFGVPLGREEDLLALFRRVLFCRLFGCRRNRLGFCDCRAFLLGGEPFGECRGPGFLRLIAWRDSGRLSSSPCLKACPQQ